VIESIKSPNTYERYEIIVVARDYGKPSLSSTTLVQIQLVSSNKKSLLSASSSSWLHVEQNSQNLIIFAGILAALFVFVTLFICLLCCVKYKLRRRKEDNSLTSSNLTHIPSMLNDKKTFSSSSSTTSSNDLQQQTANGQFTRLADDLHFERSAVS